MKSSGLAAGLLVLLAACTDSRAGEQAAAAGGTVGDSVRSRPAPETAAVPDSAALQDEQAADLVPPGGWTAGNTAVQLSGARLATLRAVRQSRHDGFDRVVFDFGAQPLPNYRLEYVDKPQHECGSGEEVWLKGDAWLSIRLEPVQAHDDSGNVTVTERSRAPDFPNLLELRLVCDFEAVVEWIAGVSSPNGYHVITLREPTRLVVDLKH